MDSDDEVVAVALLVMVAKQIRNLAMICPDERAPNWPDCAPKREKAATRADNWVGEKARQMDPLEGLGFLCLAAYSLRCSAPYT